MSLRLDRLNQQFQEEIASIIQFEMKDPGLGFVTITKVDLSKDLSIAKVSFSCLGTEADRERTQEALNRASGYVHSLVKKRLRLKTIPTITFKFDESVSFGIEIAAKLDELKRQG